MAFILSHNKLSLLFLKDIGRESRFLVMHRYSLENQFINIPVFKKAKKSDSSSKRPKYDSNDIVSKNFGFAGDKELPVFINQGFLNGTLTSTSSSDMEKQIQYNVQVCQLQFDFHAYRCR